LPKVAIAVVADLLNASNWPLSEFLPSDRSWNGNDMGGWLEGNAVATPSNIMSTGFLRGTT
jgi:hypothetical protein